MLGQRFERLVGTTAVPRLVTFGANSAAGKPLVTKAGLVVRKTASARARDSPRSERWTLDSSGGFSAWRSRMTRAGRAKTVSAAMRKSSRMRRQYFMAQR